MTSDELLAKVLPRAFRVEVDISLAPQQVVRLTRYFDGEWHMMMVYRANGDDRSVWGDADAIAAELRRLGIVEEEEA